MKLELIKQIVAHALIHNPKQRENPPTKIQDEPKPLQLTLHKGGNRIPRRCTFI